MSEFNLDPNMSEDDVINIMTQLMIKAKLAYIAESLPSRLAEALEMPLVAITSEYVDRLACAAYALSMGTPFLMIKMMGGPAKLAAMMLTSEKSDVMSPTNLSKKLRDGMATMTPKMAQAITEEAVIQAAKLCLLDWMDAGDNLTKDQMQMDSHMYFGLCVEQNGFTPAAMRQELKEHADSLSAEEYLGLPPQLRQELESWDWSNDQPTDTAE